MTAQELDGTGLPEEIDHIEQAQPTLVARIDSLALSLLPGTQAAALAAVPWVGRGNKNKADQAAVSAMRAAFATLPGQGTVVIGEGEKDDAPMLFAGEKVGAGGDPAFDLAVDPLENTKACAQAAEGAIAVLAAAPAGTLWATPGWYMDKLIVGERAAGAADITRPVEDNLQAVAEALGKGVDELVVVVLDKPRHEELVARIYGAGASVALIPEGDVLGALRVLLPDADADLLMGVGGAPEGVINACQARCLGGQMQARLAPQSDDEHARVTEAGQSVDEVMGLDTLVDSEECCFVATAVTPSQLLGGPAHTSAGWRSQSLLASRLHPMLRIDAIHRSVPQAPS